MVLEKTLESPLDSKEVKSANPKGNQPEHSLEGLMLKLKLQYSDHLMRGVDSMGMSLSKLREIVKDREAWHAAVHRVAKSRAQLSDWTTTTNTVPSLPLASHPPFFQKSEYKCFYNTVLVSAVQQRESAICIHISPPSWNSIPPPPSHSSRVSQSTEMSSLCYTQQLHTS